MMDCFCYNCNQIIYNNLSEATLTVSKYRPESVSYILPSLVRSLQLAGSNTRFQPIF